MILLRPGWSGFFGMYQPSGPMLMATAWSWTHFALVVVCGLAAAGPREGRPGAGVSAETDARPRLPMQSVGETKSDYGAESSFPRSWQHSADARSIARCQ